MQRGDLLLYTSSGKWYERLIAYATHGPYVHVAIVVDNTKIVAARTQGIAFEVLPQDTSKLTVIPMSSRATEIGINVGLSWACKQVGKAYGWSDIVYQVVKFLNPNNPFRFGEYNHWDCSDLATRYLLHAGVELPDDYDPYTVTPNDLARWAGLLEPRS